MRQKTAIHWFRRDLRLEDNTALSYALKNHEKVLPLFIFDQTILSKLNDKKDARVTFIHQQLQLLNEQLWKSGSALLVKFGNPEEVWQQLLDEFEIEAVYTNHDYEPYGIHRDKIIGKLLQQNNIPFHTRKDHVIFEKDEVIKDDGSPYTIFTPYSRKWKEKLQTADLRSFPVKKYASHFIQIPPAEIVSLQQIGFERSTVKLPVLKVDRDIISKYHETRDIPSVNGTTRLSVHLRFGTISIRQLMRVAVQLNEKYVNELIWREFYQMILWHFPGVVNGSFKREYDRIQWRNNENEFAAWCEGRTGYPIVDAGMHELNATGYMHNRVRMIVAGFLTKHLLIDWRWGEAYFAEKLLDYELASNNGGWQWAAGTGVDAAPYFRIFNPSAQTKKFDPELIYIRKWVPEVDDPSYHKPIVDHDFARQRALRVYREVMGERVNSLPSKW